MQPPFVPAQVVERERLFARLCDGRGRKLTLVACPAGFGKSTLLAAWRQHEGQARPVAWATLDDGDNDAVVLWSHVVEALARACPALPHEALAASPLREVVLPRLVNELAEHGDVALILDDFHRISGTQARETVAWFVDHLSASTRLVLSTRADPALPLAALRAHGQLLELRADDLRFTAAEAAEFLNGRLVLDLAPGDVELLVARTGGWPAGVYLAALSLVGKPDKPALVRRFDGTSAHVVDFRSSEVLSAYEPELQRFMLRTSVLERLCAELCDAVLDAPAPALDRLARTNLFLLPLDDQPAGTASITFSRSCCGSSSSAVSPRSCPSCTVARSPGTPRRARRTRRSTTRSRPAPTPRRASWSRGPGSTTSTRAARRRCSTGSRASRTRSSRPMPACSWSSRGARRCAAASTTCAGRSASPARSASSSRARCPTASRRLRRASACSARRSAGAT